MIGKVIESQIFRHPGLQIQDLYKLLHQAALGSEHAVSDRASAERWLARELAEMGEGFAEPLIDPLSPHGEIVRVHLRPYLAARYDPGLLLDAFIRTANEHHGEVQYLETYWREATSMGIFPVQEMDAFFRQRKEQGFPAVHHSPEYERLYHPAYRVISLTLCPEMRS